MAAFDAACGGDAVAAANAILERTGFGRLRDLGVPDARLADFADAAIERRELAFTPPPPDRDELLALYEAAW
jgi:alcohol dehydrogenase class IV